MIAGWGERVLLEARACLEQRMLGWNQSRSRIVVYPAGSHTRDLFVHPDFAQLNLVGVIDQNIKLRGLKIGNCEIFSLDALQLLSPEVILVSSPPHHLAIMEEFATPWREKGFEVVDLCQGAKPHAALFPLAHKNGLVFNDALLGRFKITRPGTPSKSIVMDASIWEHALEIIRNFDWFFDSADPDECVDEERILDISRPSYKTLKRSRTRLHFPSTPEPDSTTEVYLEYADLKYGDVVLDIGAYAGGSAFSFSQRVGPTGCVIALEPDRQNLASLMRNIEDHNLTNVIVEPAALWDQDGESSFEAEGFMGSSLTAVLARKSSVITVQTFTLETLLARHGLNQVQFIKMDIEGAELRVLNQAMPVLQKLHPRMVIEPHFLDYNQGILNTSVLQSILHKGGFRTRLIGQGDYAGHPMIFAWWEGN